MRPIRRHVVATTAALLLSTIVQAQTNSPSPSAGDGKGARVSLNLPAQSLAESLRAVAGQTSSNILFDNSLVEGVTAKPLKADLTIDQALKALLEGTGLTYRTTDDKTVMILAANTHTTSNLPSTGDGRGAGAEGTEGKLGLAQAEDQSKASSESDSSSDQTATAADSFKEELKEFDMKGIPEVLVRGSKSRNADIQRTKDDTLPYVVFTAEEIQRSGVLNLEEFFKQRLPMNTQSSTSLQSGGDVFSTKGEGGINLRGLGTDQTLVLVDGRRLPGVSNGLGFGQPSIAGIAPSAIERIEVLPATAGGMYGGGATGGVVNIIMKRDYSGIDVEAVYGNTFDDAVARAQFNINGGIAFSGGRTQLTFAGSHAEQNDLSSGDRDFSAKAARRLLRNYPDFPDFLAFGQLGSTANIVSLFGDSLVLTQQFGGGALNSTRTSVPVGYAGPSTDNGAGLITNAGQIDYTGPRVSLYGSPTIDSLALSLRHEFTSNFSSYLDLYGDRTLSEGFTPGTVGGVLFAGDPNNPFQQDIVYNAPLPGISSKQHGKVERRGLNGGLIVRLPRGWSASLDYGRSQVTTSANSETGIVVTSAGAPIVIPAVFSDMSAFPIQNLSDLLETSSAAFEENKNELDSVSIRAGGRIFDIPGGSVTTSTLFESRRETNDGWITTNVNPPFGVGYYWQPPALRNVKSAYLETRAPIFSTTNAKRWVRELQVMASVRRDEYDQRWAESESVETRDGPFPPVVTSINTTESTDYTAGLRYSPITDVTFRASVGTGFLPPQLSLLASSVPQIFFGPLPDFYGYHDPRRGDQTLIGDPNSTPVGQITDLGGGTSELLPEQSESFSYGLIFTPRFLPGLRVSADITSIKKTGEIYSPGLQFILDNETSFPGRVIRGQKLPGDPSSWAGPVTFVDHTALNLLHSNVRAVDFQIDYTLQTERSGEWNFYLVGTRQIKFARQTAPKVPAVDNVGFADGGPLEWRGNVGLDWHAGSWNIGLNTQYFDGYSVCYSFEAPADCAAGTAVHTQGSARIPRQIYHDAVVGYRFMNADGGVLAGMDIQFSVQNILNTEPPIITSPLSSLGYSTYGDPRLRRFTLTLRKHIGAK